MRCAADIYFLFGGITWPFVPIWLFTAQKFVYLKAILDDFPDPEYRVSNFMGPFFFHGPHFQSLDTMSKSTVQRPKDIITFSFSSKDSKEQIISQRRSLTVDDNVTVEMVRLLLILRPSFSIDGSGYS